MGLNRFEQCNPQHRDKFQYCCIKSQKVFCAQCWRHKAHAFQCHSTRCGNIQKLAHLTIDKTLEMKSLHYIAQMSSSYQKCNKSMIRFLQLKQYITQAIREDISNKLPLFLSSFVIQMLGSKSQNARKLLYQQSTCSQMLKLIKNRDGQKSSNLQACINGFEKINHMYEAMKHNLKQRQYISQFNQDKIQTKQQNIDQIYQFYHDSTINFINSIKNSVKNNIQNQIKQMLSNFNPNIDFEGVRFNSSKPNYSTFQNYQARSLVLESYPQLQQNSQSVYLGANLNTPNIQQSPQLLLETAKNFIKNKLYDMHAAIQQFKSPFPYKFAYIIATSIAPDRQYELAVIQLQKSFVKKMNKIQKSSQSSFMTSVNLVIMGPELIIIEFKNRPKNTAIISIYNHQQQRTKFYEQILEKVGFKKYTQLKKIQNNYKFQTQLSSVGLVYAYFQIAYEYLFLQSQQSSVFEGEKYAQARGNNLFHQIAQKYKDTASIDFQIGRNLNQIQQLII